MTRALQSEAVYGAIASPARRRMLDLLKEREMAVTELGDRFEMSQPAVSQHLRVLRDAGLVSVTREGRQRRYSARPARLQGVHRWLSQYERFWTRRLDDLGRVLDEEARR